MTSPGHIRAVDGLTNPKVYHRPLPVARRRPVWHRPSFVVLLVLALIGSVALLPKVPSLARQFELVDLLNDGRYLVLFQNDAEIRASGGFIGSFAVVQAQDRTIKPLYFETNIYKLDDPFAEQVKVTPPKPLQVAIGDRGWALRDANFAADWQLSAPTVLWFFEEEVKQAVGPKKAEIDAALNYDYQLDGVVAITLSAFLDVLKLVGPIIVPEENVTVTADNFFPVVQAAVEQDYFKDPNQRQTNEPKTILKHLFPLALSKVQNLPRTTQYRLAKTLLDRKQVLLYSRATTKEETLVEEGWAGALQVSADKRPEGPHDFFGIVRSSHGGNKSSYDINPIYRYQAEPKGDQLRVKVDITFEHTGKDEWPSGPNHEYIRVLTHQQSNLRRATKNGEVVTDEIDIGQESGQGVFGFWLHTNPQSSQSVSLEYELPRHLVEAKQTFGPDRYQLVLWRQPGGQSPDVSVLYEGQQLFQGRLIEDRVLAES